jgi:type IV pilus assembly protein PilW
VRTRRQHTHRLNRIVGIRQLGASLIELMVGITIGLLVVVAALGTVSFTTVSSNAVSDATRLNLQAQSLFDLLGRHLRQGASNTMVATGLPGVVQFQSGLPTAGSAIQENAAGALVITHSTQVPQAIPAFAPSAVITNCLGALAPAVGVSPNPLDSFVMPNTFTLNGGNLNCASLGQNQPVINNVEAFVVRYATRNANGTLQFQSGAAVLNWPLVEAMEVCLQLRGNSTNTPSGVGSYVDCTGANVVPADNRLHRVYRRVFVLRPEF